VLSPPQAEYLQPGEWVTGMPALAEFGPGGRRGVYLPANTTTRFAMTPGIHGASELVLDAATGDGNETITATVGGQRLSGTAGGSLATIHLAPLRQTAAEVDLSVHAASPNSYLFVSRLTFVPHRARAR
jgi:hypothetical protein